VYISLVLFLIVDMKIMDPPEVYPHENVCGNLTNNILPLIKI